MKTIQLTRGKMAVVDEGDFDRISQFKWYAHEDKKNGKFYAYRNSRNKSGKRITIAMHREIVGNPSNDVDHKNGDTLDNRRLNLRPCTSSQNGANIKSRSNNKSGYKGVSWKKSDKKWAAQITFGGKRIFLGRFLNKEDAARAYDTAAKERHGEFAVLNFGVK